MRFRTPSPPGNRSLNQPFQFIALCGPPRLRRCFTFATISTLMATDQIARRYFVSGIVQGVGFRYFTQDEADRLKLCGYVRNLRDGRVEVYAIGAPESLSRLRAMLQRGPRGAMVQHVSEEPANVEAKFARNFSITYDR